MKEMVPVVQARKEPKSTGLRNEFFKIFTDSKRKMQKKKIRHAEKESRILIWLLVL
jgi:hypothetical protein